MPIDKDLSSIQEARDLAVAAHEAWQAWRNASQAEVDRVCEAMAEAGFQASERLGRMAQEEAGFGVAAHFAGATETERIVRQVVSEILECGRLPL